MPTHISHSDQYNKITTTEIKVKEMEGTGLTTQDEHQGTQWFNL